DNGTPATWSFPRAAFWLTIKRTARPACATSTTDWEFFVLPLLRPFPMTGRATWRLFTRTCCGAANWQPSKGANAFTRSDPLKESASYRSICPHDFYGAVSRRSRRNSEAYRHHGGRVGGIAAGGLPLPRRQAVHPRSGG